MSKTTAERARIKAANEEIRLLERAKKIQLARQSLIHFAEFMMPDPEDMDDATRSLYKAAQHHILLAEVAERVESGKCKRAAISLPPQHGKTLIISKMLAAWYAGRNPRKNVIFASYNETYSRKIGAAVRRIMQSKQYAAVFPEVQLSKHTAAKDALETVQGGQLNFIGRGGSGTGLPCDLFVIDDPIKGQDEANSPAIIEDMHEWYASVVYSRARTKTAIIIVHTRWLEDDLIGRNCDPDHPWRETEAGRAEAKVWSYVNIPAVLTEGPIAKALGVELQYPESDSVISAFGNKPMAALWPSEFSLEHLASAKRLNSQTFQALYMGKPTPDDGEYFKAEWLVEYEAGDLPTNLRKYAASDHAVTEKKENDPSLLGCIGVDDEDTIWVLPHVVWDRMQTDRLVEEMLVMMQTQKPMLWWAEDDVIRKAIGPFLFKRMQEEKVYVTVDAMSSVVDKQARARAIQGRMAMRKVRFPRFAPWWPKARAELLKFPRATHDEFVDFMGLIGRGLLKQVPAEAERPPEKVIRVGSIAWIKAQAKRERRAEENLKAAGGF